MKKNLSIAFELTGLLIVGLAVGYTLESQWPSQGAIPSICVVVVFIIWLFRVCQTDS